MSKWPVQFIDVNWIQVDTEQYNKNRDMYETKKNKNNELPPFSIDVQHILKNINEGRDVENVIIVNRPLQEDVWVNHAEEVPDLTETHQVVIQNEVEEEVVEESEEEVTEKPAKKTGWAKKK
jgi:hypothetical protein